MRIHLLRYLLGSLLLSGCAIYTIDVQQGNEITATMLAALQPGMSKRDVTQLLGYPLVNDPFHVNRWDYYYSKKPGNSGITQQHSVSLIFENDQLVEIKPRAIESP